MNKDVWLEIYLLMISESTASFENVALATDEAYREYEKRFPKKDEPGVYRRDLTAEDVDKMSGGFYPDEYDIK